MTAPSITPTIAQCQRFACILVGIPSGEEAASVKTPALEFAIELARAKRATLSVHVSAPQLHTPLPMSAATASLWLAKETERLEKLTSTTTRNAAELASKAGLDVIVEHPNSPFESRSSRFVQLARVHDLTLLDAADASDTSRRDAIEDVLFDSGHALLLVPSHGGMVRPSRIAIAWEGSARSARAVKDALPFLGMADTVVAVTIEGEKDLTRMAPGADLAIWLARHGVECKLATLTAQTRDVAERLRLFVAEENMEMIVMGAFVHSRFRQAILGGVTQSLLDRPPVPLFMAH